MCVRFVVAMGAVEVRHLARRRKGAVIAGA